MQSQILNKKKLKLIFLIITGIVIIFIFDKKTDFFANDFSHLSSNFEISIETRNRNSQTKISRIYGAISPNHISAFPVIAETFENITSSNEIIERIIILSPNHFLSEEKKNFTSNKNWKTKFGILECDSEFINKLVSLNLAKLDDKVLENEHGIYNLVPFVKYFLPKAKIVPIILRDSLTNMEIKKIVKFFKKNLSSKSLIIVSSDFSHYLPKQISDFHDIASITTLYNFDYSHIKNMDVDAPACIEVLLRYLESVNACKFNLLETSTSAYSSNNEEIKQTASFVSGYYTYGEKDFKQEITFLFFGDLMLDRYVYTVAQQVKNYNYLFLNFDLFLKGVNYREANLEGPIGNADSEIKKKHMQFLFSPNFLKPLKKRFEILGLANNHILDFGEDGFIQTKELLKKENILSFGNIKNQKNDLSIILKKNKIKVGLIGYNLLFAENNSLIINEIKKLKMICDFIILFPHWGNEYEKQPSEKQQNAAKIYIDAGADLIIGSHPHVIQPIEIYKNKVIFYSLGNFIFDQHFSQETTEGLSIGLQLKKEKRAIKTSYKLYPFKINKKCQPEIADTKFHNRILEEISNNSIVNNKIKEAIKHGEYSVSF